MPRFFLLICFLLPLPVGAAPLCDMSGYRPQPGLEARSESGSVVVTWQGERGAALRASFGIDASRPVILELAARSRGARWSTLARNLVPEFTVVSGLRRTGHGLPEEMRWWVYWDAPLQTPGSGDQPNMPRRPEEIRHHEAAFRTSTCEARTNGSRLEIDFPGLSMGIFAGKLRFTAYRGSSLLRMEAIAATEELSVAYKYTAGLRGFSTTDLPRVVWRDTGGNEQRYEFGGTPNRDPVPLRARNRLAVAEGTGGSIAVFPPPHQFFFARQLEINLGFVWYRKDGQDAFSLGVRQGDSHEGYNPVWIDRVFTLYNAPPAAQQRMAAYFLLSPENAQAARESVLAYTHGDRYKPLAGYRTMVTHFHTAFTEELTKSGSLDTQAPWIPPVRALGVDIAYLCDFHGDGHPEDAGEVRLKELADYYESCARHSDRGFLILPGEEPNAYLGGHYNILFPKPVFWTLRRRPDQSLLERHSKYGRVFHASSAEDVFAMLQQENALVWQTHPRTKGSTGYPDKIRDAGYFRSDRWLGGTFKALPVDLSEQRLCERRCFDALDDMNNWGRPKYLLGEVDTYKKFPEYDLYGDFNVNYVRLDALPQAPDWTPIVAALRAGKFFVTTGEVLLRNVRVEGTNEVSADVEWTFPLEFVEAVWGDGKSTGRKVVPATDTAAFGSRRFRIPVELAGQKWVRFAAWDSAVNGAFSQPVHLPAAAAAPSGGR